MKKFIFKILALVFLISSCSQEKIHYTGINIPLKKELKGTALNTTFIFSSPQEMMIIDSLLIVHDSYNRDTCFHIFNKINGKHIGSFGNKGRGPGEIIFPSSLNYNPKTKTLTTYEANLKKIIKYNIADISTQKTISFSEIKLNSIPFFALQAIPSDDSFIIRGNAQVRFAIIDTNNKITSQFKNYPKLTIDKEENRAIFNYAPQCVLKPDGNKLAILTYIGGVLEIFDIKNNSITPNTIKYFNEPIYKSVDGFKPKWIGTTPQTVVGCDNIYATNENIYCIYEGEVAKDNEPEPKKIIVFNWDGIPQLQYEINEGLPNGIAVDEDNLYCILMNKDYEYQLYKYNYKD